MNKKELKLRMYLTILNDENPSYIKKNVSESIIKLFEKQQKEIKELKLFKKEVIDIIKYADDTAEPTYWNIRRALGLGE